MKTIPYMQRSIKCPKCYKQTLRRSIGSKSIWNDMTGREMFCDTCHLYFGYFELVTCWNYDLGDFMDSPKTDKQPHITNSGDTGYWRWKFDTVSTIDEPEWKSTKERSIAYEMVDRMFLGIPEWSMEDNSVDYGYPI